MRQLIDIATQIALMAHGGDKNKHDGELYLLHVQRVAIGARSFALQLNVDPDLAEAVAWDHDVIEDTAWALWNIRNVLENNAVNAEVVDRVIEAILLVTKKKGEDNLTYYAKIKANPLARAVKLADMTDNFRRNHKIKDEETRHRLSKKYSIGLDALSVNTTLAEVL